MTNQFLIKNTMTDMSALSLAEITTLTNGTNDKIENQKVIGVSN